MPPATRHDVEALLRAEDVWLSDNNAGVYCLRGAPARELGCEVVLRFDEDAGWYLCISETQRQKALDQASAWKSL
jgi:hypothetical protein